MNLLLRMGFALACAGFAASAAIATENYKEKSFNADTREKFEEVATGIREDMEEGGRYEHVKPDERKVVEQKLTEIDGLFAESGSIATMKQDTKIKLYNAQEVVNSILTKRDRDRVICKSEAPVGSHIPVTTCHTYGQQQDAHNQTQKQMADWGRPLCVGSCGGP